MRRVVFRALWGLLPVATCLVATSVTPCGASGTASEIETTTEALEEELTTPSLQYKLSLSRSTQVYPANIHYFANNSLLGVPVQCTPQEKECLRYNRIYFPPDQICYPLGNGPKHCRFAVNQREFERRRHIVGWCAPVDNCGNLDKVSYRMAYDGKCVVQGDLKNKCGSGAVNVAQHFFGDSECVPIQGISSFNPVYIPQPAQEDQCVFPNLRHDMVSMSNQLHVMYRKCSDSQRRCFERNKVWCDDTERCCELFDNSTCNTRHWVTLNRTAWDNGVVDAGCFPQYPCGKKARRMAFDGQCHNASEVLRVLCPGGVLLPNAFGEMSCVTRNFYKHYVQLGTTLSNTCEVTHKLSFDDNTIGTRLTTDCGLNGTDSCIGAF